jgi:hypothetical protein
VKALVLKAYPILIEALIFLNSFGWRVRVLAMNGCSGGKGFTYPTRQECWY